MCVVCVCTPSHIRDDVRYTPSKYCDRFGSRDITIVHTNGDINLVRNEILAERRINRIRMHFYTRFVFYTNPFERQNCHRFCGTCCAVDPPVLVASPSTRAAPLIGVHAINCSGAINKCIEHLSLVAFIDF